MKPVIIIAIAVVLVTVLLILISAFAQSSAGSIGTRMMDTAASAFVALVFLIIPILIVLGILKHYGILNDYGLKIAFVGLGSFFLALMIVNVSSFAFLTDQENSQLENERNSERIQAIMKESKASSEKAYNEKYADEIKLGIDPRSIEDLAGLEMKFGNEWDDLDTLKERQRSGEITFNQKCQTLANLMNANISDDYLYTFWNEAFLQECR